VRKNEKGNYLYAVETENLTKYYSHGKVKALDEFSINIQSGQIFSLLGPNGAGKTTLVKLLIGIIHPTRGSGSILGTSIKNYRMHDKIGYLSENHRFPEFLTAEQVLYYYGKMAGVSKTVLNERIPLLLKRVKLEEWQKVKIHKYSKGMMQRLGLAHALINDPQILFLDEPTDGIDPIGRREIRDQLKLLRNEGKTIFLNSHLLSEVERVSDEIAILKDGKLLKKGNVDDFISVKEQYEIRVNESDGKLERTGQKLDIPVTVRDGTTFISVQDEKHLNHFIDELRKQQLQIKAIIPRKISLEDFFIDVIEEKEGNAL
jgi:ABC-2 type transport system ATP-binding protein